MIKNAVHTLYITKDCFMKCRYCYEAIQKNSHMSRLNIIKALNLINKYDIAPEMIEIFGGEPLLNWNGLKVVLNYGRIENIKLSTITNGVLLNKENIGELKRYDVKVGISYDGRNGHDFYRLTKTGKGTESIVRRNIIKAINSNLNITICMAFHKANENSMLSDIEEMVTWGVENFKIYTVHKNQFAVIKEKRYQVYEELKNYASECSVSIDFNLDYTNNLNYHFYYYDEKVKIQKPGSLGHWHTVGWD